jgi:hypothetical protein
VRGAAVRAAGLLAGLALLACGCGSTHHGEAAGSTTVRYGIYPGNTSRVSTTNPTSVSCHQDAVAFARGSAQFLTHYAKLAASPADPYYMLLRQQLADFQARRCDPKLLGSAIKQRLSPPKQRMLLAHASSPMAAALRRALSAADG